MLLVSINIADPMWFYLPQSLAKKTVKFRSKGTSLCSWNKIVVHLFYS